MNPRSGEAAWCELTASVDSLPLSEGMREHVNNCASCWKAFCSLRWEVARPTEEYAELREFLGEDFTDSVDSSWELARQWNAEPRDSAEDVRRFYQEADAYVYNLTIWQASGGRPDYVGRLRHSCVTLMSAAS